MQHQCIIGLIALLGVDVTKVGLSLHQQFHIFAQTVAV